MKPMLFTVWFRTLLGKCSKTDGFETCHDCSSRFRCRYHSNLRLPLMYPHPYSQITVETEFDNPLYETGGVSIVENHIYSHMNRTRMSLCYIQYLNTLLFTSDDFSYFIGDKQCKHKINIMMCFVHIVKVCVLWAQFNSIILFLKHIWNMIILHICKFMILKNIPLNNGFQ